MDHAADTIRIRTVRERTSFLSRLAGLVAVIVPPVGLVTGTVLLWNHGVNWVDLVVLGVFYVPCGLGITVGWHRYFSHKSFETSPAVKALLAILGSMAMQGPLTQWVTDHRKHHALSDQPGDPAEEARPFADGADPDRIGCLLHPGEVYVDNRPPTPYE